MNPKGKLNKSSLKECCLWILSNKMFIFLFQKEIDMCVYLHILITMLYING